ncbi:MAG: glycosyltransferase family 2 protein [Paludibacter sp.]
MPKLSIITINYNNASGLRKTIESVLNQTSNDFEYIVVDGASIDTSCQVISDQCLVINGETIVKEILVKCVSEVDNGIYHAMNKGICMAKGEYIQFLNSGDILAASDVTERMLTHLFSTSSGESEMSDILYGNMLKQLPMKILRDCGFKGEMPTLLDFYTGTLNHSAAYIKRILFDTYGQYDESLKIVSDWKWYLQVIVMNGIIPRYIDIDVSIFDMSGISTLNAKLVNDERKHVLSEILPISILIDYKRWSFPIDQLKRINRYKLIRNIFLLVERILFKWEKWFSIK